MQHWLEELLFQSCTALCGSMPDPGVVSDHVRQEALTQHWLSELQGSLRYRAPFFAGTAQAL